MNRILIYRSNWIIRNRIGFIGLAVVLCLAFIMPHFTWNWLPEALVVLFYFPLLVALGAGSSLSPRLKGLCTFSGNTSYPLYMTHHAAIWIFGNCEIKGNNGLSQLFLRGGLIKKTIFLTLYSIRYWIVHVRSLALE